MCITSLITPLPRSPHTALSSNEQQPMRGALRGYLFYGYKRIMKLAPKFAVPLIVGECAKAFAERMNAGNQADDPTRPTRTQQGTVSSRGQRRGTTTSTQRQAALSLATRRSKRIEASLFNLILRNGTHSVTAGCERILLDGGARTSQGRVHSLPTCLHTALYRNEGLLTNLCACVEGPVISDGVKASMPTRSSLT